MAPSLVGTDFRIAIGYESFGPYHLARLNSVARRAPLLAIEFSRKSSIYGWQPTETKDFHTETLSRDAMRARFSDIAAKLDKALSEFHPDVVFVPGWAAAEALAMLRWCRRAGVTAVVMSDSQEIDAPRVALKESLKGALLRQFDGAFVAGERHAAYLTKLGFHDRPVARGYDVVDNRHFAPSPMTPPPSSRELFLCCARLVAKKNLVVLLEAFRLFVDRVGTAAAPPLVIVGEGPMRAAIENERDRLGLKNVVKIPGFSEYAALPTFYQNARCFILPSSVEQWGLVVNEAMAAGCPVLVSERAGCVPELVRKGENGFTFDPTSPRALAEKMFTLHQNPEILDRFGAKSMEIVAAHGLEAHVSSVLALTNAMPARSLVKNTLGQNLILHVLLMQALKERRI